MTESLPHLISKFGYLIVFLASLIEGESIILTASALASQGHLNIFKIAFLVFIGTLLADQGLYFVGRIFGKKIFARFPTLKLRSKKIMLLLDKYSTLFILSFRFIYGIRILSPIVIGIAEIPPKKYMILNFIAALIWTILNCLVGYFLGDFIFNVFYKIDPIIKYIGILLGIALLLEILHRLSGVFDVQD